MTACSRCNKPLTVYASVMRGVGPVCWRKLIREAEENAAKPENINWDHLTTLVARIRNDWISTVPPRFVVDFVVDDEVLASFRDLARIAEKDDHTDQDRALVSANAWTIAAAVPDEVLADNSFLVNHVRNLLDLVVLNDEAVDIDRRLTRRRKTAERVFAKRAQANLVFA